MDLAARLAEADVAALPDWAAADRLNAPDPALPKRRVAVATSAARGVLLATGEWSAIVMTAEPGSGAPPAVRGLCILVRDTLTLTEALEMQIPQRYAATLQALDGLVAAGLIASETRAALLALAEAPQSWAEHAGVEVTPRSVGLARGGV